MISLFLAGDVMTGRGVDQVLPHPSDPALHEPYVRDARVYVELAEQVNGPIAKPVDFAYVWGEALAVLDRFAPDARIVNLETSVTRSDDWWPGKGINYRMHPDNVACLTAAGLDCCALANNHVLDWGYAGLDETLSTLRAAGLGTAGAGADAAEARAPAVVDVPGKGRVLVFACGWETSGIPELWGAGEERPGVNLLPVSRSARALARTIEALRQPGDVVVVSIHWGGNWGYGIPREQRELARALVDGGGVDVVHGHSSHHAKGVEIYRGRPIIYGCGDFVNDYEGIAGHEGYRDDLPLAYFVALGEQDGSLVSFDVVPFKLARMRLQTAADADVAWVRDMLAGESAALGAAVERTARDTLSVRPAAGAGYS